MNLLIDFKKTGSAIWIENQRLKVLLTDRAKEQGYKNSLAKNKNILLQTLSLNNIFTKKQFFETEIFKGLNTKNELSLAQERLFFINNFDCDNPAYNMPLLLSLNRNIKLKSLEQAFNKLIERHEVLRTVIKIDGNGKAFFEIIDSELKFDEYDWSNTDIQAQITKDISRVFNIELEIPIRVSIYHDENDIKLLINTHHIANDAWSLDIILKDLNEFYNAIEYQTKPKLAKLSIQYQDFAIHQRQYSKKILSHELILKWKKRFDKFPYLDIPTDYQRVKGQTALAGHVSIQLDEIVSKRIRSIAKSSEVSLYTILLSAYFVLLKRYTGRTDIVVGSPVSGRNYYQIENLVGFFVNLYAHRCKINDSDHFYEILKQVNVAVKEMNNKDLIPFSILVNEVENRKDIDQHPIFQTILSLQPSIDISDSDIFSKLFQRFDYTRLDLEMFVCDVSEKFLLNFVYKRSLFKEQTVKRLLDLYVSILHQVVKDIDIRIKDINILSYKEFNKIVYDWNQTDSEYPRDKTIYELFEEQVKQNPNNIALVFEEQQLTYQELNNKANQLARYIRKQYQQITSQELEADTLIPLCLDRSLDMVIAILAVMKAGGAYVPMDPEYPQERFKHILSDTDAKLIITQSHLKDKLSFYGLSIESRQNKDFGIITTDTQEYLSEDIDNLSQYSQANDLVYVIYTSGTTGLPKGVMVEHKSTVQILYAKYFINATQRGSLWTNYTFDVSVYEIFSSLCF
ncbi:condensation domain-containing protein, partial [Francisella philomiragia]|uniref:condensation domain-containing protein n=1 Tax=Francisella philomiragia TaxID=28110 RepID=UPI001908E0D3